MKIYNINTIILSKRKCSFLFTIILFALFQMSVVSCSDFVEVEPPKNTLVSQTVFEDASTVESALANLYEMLRGQGIGTYSLSADMGIYSDELDYFLADPNDLSIYIHNILPINESVSKYWVNAYRVIYSANAIVEGVESSEGLTSVEKSEFMGQALFVRAYVHSILVGIYGDIPYITTTDYRINNSVARLPGHEVYYHIITDLMMAVDMLGTTDATGEKVIPNRHVANALLSRIYLYTGNWEQANATATQLIDAFILEPELEKVFLKGSRETIWQLMPEGVDRKNAPEANLFVILAIPGQQYALTETLLKAFEEGDLRREEWVGSFTSNDGATTLQFPYKYKATLSETESLEYSIVFRLAEQYLIRAEARAHMGNLTGARQDLDTIRQRAGLDGTSAMDKETLLEAIQAERFTELFAENGHRWFDLKRSGKAGEVLSTIKPNWKPTHVVWPIPENELEINPNLRPQNEGY
ncbi:RagB/SusD family nutrient uptake outer membrane protein [Galbibacter mesophilus]|uniref:RagB/SusD family nutrient uptake outer membrane protein n=1 Tax=Galbibacter mesophilus TaxID=379069 RepID=UPI00191EF3E6|nr:RagB/SusD family nutrient uptake outer membrane protein [Galbibacter mesophilus]MCM5663658.1 RagB/SusD family nutrient uptake outer membrane protein [Galbibacter mesophilus]